MLAVLSYKILAQSWQLFDIISVKSTLEFAIKHQPYTWFSTYGTVIRKCQQPLGDTFHFLESVFVLYKLPARHLYRYHNSSVSGPREESLMPWIMPRVTQRVVPNSGPSELWDGWFRIDLKFKKLVRARDRTTPFCNADDSYMPQSFRQTDPRMTPNCPILGQNYRGNVKLSIVWFGLL